MTLRLDPARMQLISAFVDTYLKLSPQEERQFEVELGGSDLPEKEAIVELLRPVGRNKAARKVS